MTATTATTATFATFDEAYDAGPAIAARHGWGNAWTVEAVWSADETASYEVRPSRMTKRQLRAEAARIREEDGDYEMVG